MSDIEVVISLLIVLFPLVLIWKVLGNRKFWKLFGISFFIILFLFITPLMLAGTNKENTPQLNSQIVMLRWIYLGLIFSPSIIFFLKHLVPYKGKEQTIPFYSLQKTIIDKYPDETIIKTDWGLEQIRTNWLSRYAPLMPGVRRIPKPVSVLLSIAIPIRFAETKKAYYIDYRLSNFITFLIVSSLLTFWLSRNLASTSASYYLFLYIGVELFLCLFYMAFWQLGLIETIRKGWVSGTNQVGLVHTFYGEIPASSSVTLSENPSLKSSSPIQFERKFILI